MHELLVDQLRVQNFWLNTLPHIPGDVFYYFPHNVPIADACYFAAAVMVDHDIFTCIGTATTLTYLLIGTADPVGLIQFFECLHTFTGVVREGAFIINDVLFVCDWSEPAIQQLEQAILDDGAEEIGVDIQRDKEYYQFWRAARRYLYLYNSDSEISAESLMKQQKKLFSSFIQVYEDSCDED